MDFVIYSRDHSKYTFFAFNQNRFLNFKKTTRLNRLKIFLYGLYVLLLTQLAERTLRAIEKKRKISRFHRIVIFAFK